MGDCFATLAMTWWYEVFEVVTAMARRAVHTAQVMTYNEMLNSEEEFTPNLDKLTMDSPAPLLAGPDGKYPTPQPGILKNHEY